MSRTRVSLHRLTLVAIGFALAALTAARPLAASTSQASVSSRSVAVAPAAHSSSGWHGGGWHGGGFHGGGRIYGGLGWWYPWGGWYGYPYGYPYPSRYGNGSHSRWTAVKTDVEPDEAALYLDGKLIGTADDFDGFPDRLYLGRGHYRLEFRLDGYETYTSEIDAAPGRTFRIDHHLKKMPGARHYGTYEPARPEGGVVRFWAKRGTSVEPESPEGSRYRPREEYREDREEGDDQDEAPAPEERHARPNLESRLVFEIEPSEAAVYVDGRFAGAARELNSMEEGLAVEPGEHRVVVTCPGYREGTLEVTANEGRNGRVKLRLSK